MSDLKHATFYSSFNKRCKCQECKDFRNGYMREYRRRIREGIHVPVVREREESTVGLADLPPNGGWLAR